jgi:hypothetical protein
MGRYQEKKMLRVTVSPKIGSGYVFISLRGTKQANMEIQIRAGPQSHPLVVRGDYGSGGYFGLHRKTTALSQHYGTKDIPSPQKKKSEILKYYQIPKSYLSV